MQGMVCGEFRVLKAIVSSVTLTILLTSVPLPLRAEAEPSQSALDLAAQESERAVRLEASDGSESDTQESGLAESSEVESSQEAACVEPSDEADSNTPSADKPSRRPRARPAYLRRTERTERANAKNQRDPNAPVTRTPVTSGFLFIEGEYVPPPYVIKTEGDNVYINDEPILAEFASPRYEAWGMEGGRPTAFIVGQQLESDLRQGNVIVVFEREQLVSLYSTSGGYWLLCRLVGEDSRFFSNTMSELPEGYDVALFQQWVNNYKPSDELQQRARGVIEQYRRVEAESRQAVAAVRRNETLLYLVTVFGMVSAVAATGHLLSMKPPSARDPEEASPEMLIMVSRSLGLVVVLSSLDLFWTIMASQSGKMVELNPIGSQLLHDPVQLIAAKAAMICMSVGLLYFLRHHRQAQVAAWWACLICTLLTFRWLTFNSMFVS